MKQAADKINSWIALKITGGVSTMWCAYVFMAIALTSLPSVIALHSVNADVQWVAQTFLQLVLLSVIMVGQKVQASRTIALHEKVDASQEILVKHHRALQDLVKHHHTLQRMIEDQAGE